MEKATARLRAELLELDVTDVLPMDAGQAPPGTRAGGATEVGGLLVSINQAPVLLKHIVGTIQHWLSRDRGGRTAELTIAGDSLVVTGITSAEQERLIEAWLRAILLTKNPKADHDARALRADRRASSAIEYAFEDDRVAEVGQRSPSVFTSALVHGLATGDADTGRDGLVDVDELYDYVHARVRSTTQHQTPHKWADVQGTIARRAPST